MGKMYFPQYETGRKKGINLVVGRTVLEHIRRAGGIEINSECGGQGRCEKDLIRVEKGLSSLTKITPAEQKFLDRAKLTPGYRLACQARVARDDSDIEIFIRDFGKYTILTESIDTGVEISPCVFRKDGKVFYHTGEELGSYKGRMLGLAVDIGTTTLVMQVVDLETGKNIGTIASKNPQIAYGNDVISRGGYAMTHEGGLKELQAVVVNGIKSSLEEMEENLKVAADSINKYIYDVVIVGNSIMRSIFCGQDPSPLAVMPFEPSDKKPVTLSASGMGFSFNPEARVYGPPLIGGHAGADCLADIISTRLYESGDIEMIIDIGTNGEVVIGNRHKIMTASCAAGGAYEGYQISCGVGAVEGAITNVWSDNGKLEYATLGGKPAAGVCGSGVIDLLAELLRIGVMDERARIGSPYRITDGLSISQDDINQLIMAKAGLRTDQDLLVKYFGTSYDNVSKIFLAGAFGNFIDVSNAMKIGLYPPIDKNKFVRFGNGALAGARDMLLSKRRRADAERIAVFARHTKPNELEGTEFQYMVAGNMYFNRNILQK
ncbi:MAG: DUF4445 domain-containing protein [Candidatus Omnitrophica bacterium]|nr:DUF4445 domain-containing protein [Candidatus Omnitrophota bacterium]